MRASPRAPSRPVSGHAPDALGLAIDRAAGARAIGGNRLEHHPDSPRALDLMLELIARASRWVHFENYIIRDDRTGRRFAAALAERARAGVSVRVLYDALGSLGTSGRYWRGLRQAGAEVRAFHPILSRLPFRIIQRDHRKLLVTDGTHAMVGGLCIGDEWAGDPERRRRPWRDTMIRVGVLRRPRWIGRSPGSGVAPAGRSRPTSSRPTRRRVATPPSAWWKERRDVPAYIAPWSY